MSDIQTLKFGEFWADGNNPVMSKVPVPGHVRIIAAYQIDAEGLIRVEAGHIPNPWIDPRRFALYMKRMDGLERIKEIEVNRRFDCSPKPK